MDLNGENRYSGCSNKIYCTTGSTAAARFCRSLLRGLLSHLREKGAGMYSIEVVRPTFFGKYSLYSLILRNNPTLTPRQVSKEIMGARATKENSCTFTCIIEEITPLGSIRREKIEKRVSLVDRENAKREILAFLDTVAEKEGEKRRRISIWQDAPGITRFKMPEENTYEKVDNSEYLIADLLADEITHFKELQLSPLHIDDDYSITLPLYPQIKIELAPLPKALYILLLLHPEGFILKNITDYSNELRSIYCIVSGRRNPSVINKMLGSLTDPTTNPLHKNLSIIRHAFLSKLRFDIAQQYIPTQGRHSLHRIPLEREKIVLPHMIFH